MTEYREPREKLKYSIVVEPLTDGFVFGEGRAKYFLPKIDNISVLIEGYLKENVGKKLTLKVEILEF